MNHQPEDKPAKAEWLKPVLVDLDLDIGDVRNGIGIGSDGGTGLNTSAS